MTNAINFQEVRNKGLLISQDYYSFISEIKLASEEAAFTNFDQSEFHFQTKLEWTKRFSGFKIDKIFNH